MISTQVTTRITALRYLSSYCSHYYKSISRPSNHLLHQSTCPRLLRSNTYLKFIIKRSFGSSIRKVTKSDNLSSIKSSHQITTFRRSGIKGRMNLSLRTSCRKWTVVSNQCIWTSLNAHQMLIRPQSTSHATTRTQRTKPYMASSSTGKSQISRTNDSSQFRCSTIQHKIHRSMVT